MIQLTLPKIGIGLAKRHISRYLLVATITRISQYWTRLNAIFHIAFFSLFQFFFLCDFLLDLLLRLHFWFVSLSAGPNQPSSPRTLDNLRGERVLRSRHAPRGDGQRQPGGVHGFHRGSPRGQLARGGDRGRRGRGRGRRADEHRDGLRDEEPLGPPDARPDRFLEPHAAPESRADATARPRAAPSATRHRLWRARRRS